MNTINNYEAKLRELRDIVKEAALEQSPGYPLRHRNPSGPVFEAAGFQTYHTDRLADLLKTTDALYVLNEALQ